VVFSLLGLLIYGPALHGAFIGDDGHYVHENPYIQDLNLQNVMAIWNPVSVVVIVVENYAPVHLMLHGIEWQFFGMEVYGYHVVNVLFHALASVMLVVVFRRGGSGRAFAIAGAALFLVHPANVESVAWISQLKSSAALVLSLGALLAHPRRPALGLLLFALALFAKPFSAFALIVVALVGWQARAHAIAAEREGLPDARDPKDFRWPWLAGWFGVVLLFAVMEIFAFSHSAGQAPPLYEDLGVRYRTLFSVALRYYAMSISGLGLSSFHEPPPVLHFFDPMFLGGVLVTAGLAWRGLFRLRQHHREGVYWLWAAVCFAPLSGVVPLPYPMADRYLYFILPGLIGAVLLIAEESFQRLAERLEWKGPRLERLNFAVLLLVGLYGLHLASASHSRAAIFQNAEKFMADSEMNYPNGAAANTRKASRAAREGDFETSIEHLRLAHARGYNRLDHLLKDPAYNGMWRYPPFVELREVMAREWLARLAQNPEPSQIELMNMAQAYIVLDDLPAALNAVERGIALPGPLTEDLHENADKLSRQIRLKERLRERQKRSDLESDAAPDGS